MFNSVEKLSPDWISGSTMSTRIILLLLLRWSHGQYYCGSTNSCLQWNLVCPTNSDCLIQCLGVNSCSQASVTCPLNGDCELRCGSANSCYQISIIRWSPQPYVNTLYCQPPTGLNACPTSLSVPPTPPPTPKPTARPTPKPTTKLPTPYPSQFPSNDPSISPSIQPSSFPSNNPSVSPSQYPRGSPSKDPSQLPSTDPSNLPSTDPSESASKDPSTSASKEPFQNPQSTATATSKPTPRPTSGNELEVRETIRTNSNEPTETRDGNDFAEEVTSLTVMIALIIVSALCVIALGIAVWYHLSRRKLQRKAAVATDRMKVAPNVIKREGEEDSDGGDIDDLYRMNSEDNYGKVTTKGPNDTDSLYDKAITKEENKAINVPALQTPAGLMKRQSVEELYDSKHITKGQMPNVEGKGNGLVCRCFGCGKRGFGKIYDGDGMFYCKGRAQNYMISCG
eukprot:92371_1